MSLPGAATMLFHVGFGFIAGLWSSGKFQNCRVAIAAISIGDRKGTPENFCDKGFAELSGELSGANCLKALVLLGNDR